MKVLRAILRAMIRTASAIAPSDTSLPIHWFAPLETHSSDILNPRYRNHSEITKWVKTLPAIPDSSSDFFISSESERSCTFSRDYTLDNSYTGARELQLITSRQCVQRESVVMSQLIARNQISAASFQAVSQIWKSLRRAKFSIYCKTNSFVLQQNSFQKSHW